MSLIIIYSIKKTEKRSNALASAATWTDDTRV